MIEAKTKRVLVVEDDPDTREMLRFALEDAGFSVLTAPSATMAEEDWGKFSPQLVITDYMMPGKTGLELLEYLRDRVLVPIIIYTAYPSDHLRDAADKRFAEVIPKGDLEVLIKSVRSHLSV